MRVFTSYFGNWREWKYRINNAVPISIAGRTPELFNGYKYTKLAPRIGFWKIWAQTHDNDFYMNHYFDEVIKNLDPAMVLNEIYAITGGKDAVLLCYERTEEFCHRHMVAGWLNMYIPAHHQIIELGDGDIKLGQYNQFYLRLKELENSVY